MTLVNDLGWTTVPLVTAVAFTFMGIEGIADEIEMPFGHDERDLPLGMYLASCPDSTILLTCPLIDRYCEDLKEEIKYGFFLRYMCRMLTATQLYD
jgi:putative membrane protein